MSLPPRYQAAWDAHGAAAVQALQVFQGMAQNAPQVPGMDTPLRMAVRIQAGRSIQEAAAREYVYRWGLALGAMQSDVDAPRGRPNPFASYYAPHALGL